MLWSLFFRVMYRLLRAADPAIRVAWRRALPGLRQVVELRVVGRRSGVERGILVTRLTVGGHWYVGHPNGPAEWVHNLSAAGGGQVVAPGRGRRPEAVQAIRLYAGPEREAVIRATWSQQPFPANVVYALARRHVRAVGVFFRLNPVDGA